ncbi:unnamed protein product [Gordionus sp. m RMFG-2023]
MTDDDCIKKLKSDYTMINGVFVEKNGTLDLPADFDFLINPQMSCYEESHYRLNYTMVTRPIFLMAVVHTAPDHFNHRASIRETWGSIKKYFNYNLNVVFLVGTTSIEHLQNQLVNESQTYGDIVQASFVDSYQNMTYKTAMGLKWISYHCPHAEFVLKIDDDIYVDIFHLISMLDNFKETYGSYWIKNVDHIKPRSRLLPYIHNQTKSKTFTEYDYMEHGVFFNRFMTVLKNRSSQGQEIADWVINRVSVRDKTVVDELDYKCLKNSSLTMLDVDEKLSMEHQKLFGKMEGQLRDLILCNVIINSNIVRIKRMKWYTTEKEYSGKFFEPFCMGMATILTPPTAFKLYKAYFTQPYLSMEDVHVTGKLARIAGIFLISIDYMFMYDWRYLEKWIEDNNNRNTSNILYKPWTMSTRFKYIFNINGGFRDKTKTYWLKTLEGNFQDDTFTFKRFKFYKRYL